MWLGADHQLRSGNWEGLRQGAGSDEDRGASKRGRRSGLILHGPREKRKLGIWVSCYGAETALVMLIQFFQNMFLTC
jgi:hypothetical protein